jgi:hypothetical protein
MILTKATYDKLIMPNGQPQYGCFSQPFTQINHWDFDYCDNMDKPANRLQKHFHFNQFQFIAVHGNHYTLACAIANVRYAANAFVYLFNHKNRTLQHYSFMQPLGLHCHLSSKPNAGQSRFSKGKAAFKIIAHHDSRHYDLNIKINSDIHIDLSIASPAEDQSVSVCTRTGYNGWAYTYKQNALPVSGLIHWKDDTIAVARENALANIDWSCGYMRRETAWNWASISAHLSDDTRFGLNLATGVNETSFSENAFWIDGQLHPLGPAIFNFNRQNRMDSWQITTANKQVELTFIPEAQHREKINALILASNFTQLPGRYYGTITDDSGKSYQLDGVYGLAEDHYAKW